MRGRGLSVGLTLGVLLGAMGVLAPAAYAAPTNDDFADAVVIDAIPFSDERSTFDATDEPGEPEGCGVGSQTVWYRYSATADERLTADTYGSTFDTVLAVYTGSTVDTLDEIDCNDDSFDLQSKVSFDAVAGETYHFQVGGYAGETGELTFRVSPPTGISGTVTDEDGTPLEYICVTAYQLYVDPYDDWEYYEPVGWASTSEDGVYILDGLVADTYKVGFQDCDEGTYLGEFYDDKPNVYEADGITVTEGLTTDIDAVLSAGGTISGTVTDEEGAPLDGLCVQAFNVDEYVPSVPAWTSSDGSFVIRGLRTGDHKVRFNRCNYYYSYGFEGAGSAPPAAGGFQVADLEDDEQALESHPVRQRNPYEVEWFDDQDSFDAADIVLVTQGLDTPDIDAVLGLRPRPDAAVTSLTVRNTPLRTDAADLPGAGVSREIELTVENLGNGVARRTVIEVTACPRTTGSCDSLFWDVRRIAAGASLDLSIDWNALGMVGDVIISARARVADDPDRTNDRASVRHYVLVGGTGVGVGCVRPPFLVSTCPL